MLFHLKKMIEKIYLISRYTSKVHYIIVHFKFWYLIFIYNLLIQSLFIFLFINFNI